MDAHQAQNARAYGSIFDCLTGAPGLDGWKFVGLVELKTTTMETVIIWGV